MKKVRKPDADKDQEKISKVEEPAAFYGTVRKIPALKDLTYNDFKKVADKVPFTQAEWAAVLHISERTLQRYAKDNHAFAPINAERFDQINFVIKRAKEVFGSTDKFYRWLKKKPSMLEGTLSVDSLSSYEGIHMVLTQLGRIEHGLFA
jgi:putative toxin-antitoxin system antitoxin component (TIGR02293 family)